MVTRSPSSIPSHVDRLVALLIDQHRRWSQGDTIRIETYLEHHPELHDDPAVLGMLVAGEILWRTDRGESPDLDEYLRRFPQVETALRRQFAPAAPTLPGP